MKLTIDFNEFRDAFRRYDRLDNFSREGLEMLFDHCEECDPDMELDVIALCCDYTEADWETIAQDYFIDLDGVDEDDKPQAVMEYLCDNTTVLGETSKGAFIYANF
jgi:hypothetical protein